MTERTTRPIIFSAPMVRAILAGNKTQTRRIVKSLPGDGWEPETPDADQCRLGEIVSSHPKKGRFGVFTRREIHPDSGNYEHDLVPCPYGAPSDLLWLRETWGKGSRPDPFGGYDGIEYRADEALLDGCDLLPCYKVKEPDDVCLGDYQSGWKSPIHMPRWASRITLEITDVRVERLGEITEDDARAEGITDGGCLNCGEHEPCGCDQPEPSAVDGFAALWQSIHGMDGWHSNPWVWVIQFQAHQMNINDFLEARND